MLQCNISRQNANHILKEGQNRIKMEEATKKRLQIQLIFYCNLGEKRTIPTLWMNCQIYSNLVNLDKLHTTQPTFCFMSKVATTSHQVGLYSQGQFRLAASQT